MTNPAISPKEWVKTASEHLRTCKVGHKPNRSRLCTVCYDIYESTPFALANDPDGRWDWILHAQKTGEIEFNLNRICTHKPNFGKGLKGYLYRKMHALLNPHLPKAGLISQADLQSISNFYLLMFEKRTV